MQFDLRLTSSDPTRPSIPALIRQGIVLPNLVAIGHSWAIYFPCLTLADTCMTFDPSIALHFGQMFILPTLVAIGHFWTIWPQVDSAWPLFDLRPQQCITFWSWVLSTKIGGHRTFLKQLDLWMTFDLWSGHFENILSNIVGPSPTLM